MPTVYPIAWEPAVITGRYRHLMMRDVPVWERFLEKHGAEFSLVAYDVAIGGQEPDDPELPDHQRAGWRYTTALKIDALLRDDLGVWTIEVKPAASTAAIGAALVYARLLAREEPELIIQGGGIVCLHAPPDIAAVAAELALRVWVV